MALTILTSWAANDVLTAAALVAEFNNIYNNSLSLVSPWTADMEAGGFRLQGLALGSAADPAVQFTGTGSNDGIFSPGNDRLAIVTAGVTRMEVMAGGIVYIGADATPANAGMTTGLYVDQGAANNEIMAFSASAVAHGITTETLTDNFATISKLSSTAGGYYMAGWSSGTGGVRIDGVHTTDTAVRSTAASAAVLIGGFLKSGTTVAVLGADSNLLAVRTGTTTRFILDSDGDSHQDVGTAWTNFDECDDIALLEAVAVSLARESDPLRHAFVGNMRAHRDALEAMPGKPLVSFNDGPGGNGVPFANMSRLTMLHTGAIRQLGQRFNQIERALQAAGIALVA